VVPDIDPLRFIPAQLHRHIGEVGTDAEHRHVAVGFIAFGGVDELLGHHGGDHTATVLHDFIASCQAVFDRYEVCFLYADIYGNGGKVFFTAGAPVSHEDNEERLLRAALDINATHYPGLHLHTGLNRGYVFAGDVGATFRRTYTIIGDAVNTAARVMASCDEDGQIRTMPQVLDLATSRFEAAAQTPFAAKGKALPLETFAVGQPLGPRRPDAPLPLVGRVSELSALRKRLDIARAGEGHLIHVVGEAGVGKSRLVDELRAEAEAGGVATLATFAERYERETPYYAIRQLVDALDKADAFGKALSDATSFEADAVPRVLARELIALVDEALDGPALWVIENGHLLDDGSIAVLRAAIPDLPAHPWLLVLVSRDDADDAPPAIDALTVLVDRLSPADGADLARAAHPELLPTQARLLAERADGSPLLIRQLVAGNLDDIALSDSVEAAVAARIDRLAPEVRDILRTASVLGGRFDVSDLAALLDQPRIDLAALADFLAIADGEAVFRQTVYRDVAYGGLTFKRRVALHRRAATLIEGRPGVAAGRLSFHFHRAQTWKKSWAYSITAAEEALETAAKIVAASLFARAIEAGRRIRPELTNQEFVAAFVNQSEALMLAGRLDDADEVVQRGRRYARETPLERAALLRNRVAICEQRGDASGALRWARRALHEVDDALGLDLSTPAAAEVLVPLLIMCAKGALDTGDLASARSFATRAHHVAASGSHELQGRVHTLDVFVAFAMGDLERALAAAERSVEAHRGDGRYSGSTAGGLLNLASLKHLAGDWVAAEELNRESIALNELVGNDVQAATAEANLAEVLVDQGRWAEADALLERAGRGMAGQYAEGEEFVETLRSRLAARRDHRAGVPDEALAPVISACLAGDEEALAELGEGVGLEAVVARAVLGRALGDDEDAKRLGIVAVPEWAKPIVT
jgi:tetratricopeptide (TPR) repeat protein